MTKNPPTMPDTPPTTKSETSLADTLTATVSTVHDRLQAARPDTTVTDLALAASLGRSTVGKALADLEKRGLAVRQTGETTDGRRAADRWSATAAPERPQPAVADTPDSGPDTDRKEPDRGAEQAQQAVTTAERATPPAPTESEASESSSAPAVSAEQLATLRKRLRPGALREQVLAHLRAHPAEAFTATRISRAIEKSSGAIANSLVTLSKQGLAEQVDAKPRTYRATVPAQQ